MSPLAPILAINKPIGLTPVQLIALVRETMPAYADATLGFAGRLDPMAEGVTLLMVNDENKNRATYLKLDKEYESELLFGFATDTFDALGLVTATADAPEELHQRLAELLQTYIGDFMQPFPPYSSKPVGGKALFSWANEGMIDEVEIPSAPRKIYDITLLDVGIITQEQLSRTITERIHKVSGSFRQKEILLRWKKAFEDDKRQTFLVATIRATVSSGTYIRSLADDIGKKLNSAALALSIKRTRVGPYTIEKSVSL
jgi:tRNA pseudouridine55 synthase